MPQVLDFKNFTIFEVKYFKGAKERENIHDINSIKVNEFYSLEKAIFEL